MPTARQPFRLRIRNQHPADTELFFEPLEVGESEAVPSRLGLYLLRPFGAKYWNLRDDGRVFDGVCQLAALGQGSEAVVILAGQGHVIWIESEVGVHRSVLPDPGKSLKPRVGRLGRVP